MAAFEYAKFADFAPDATQAALELFEARSGPSSPEMDALRTKLQEARRAHGLEDDATTASITTEALSEESAVDLEEQVTDMMDEPMTSEEAAAMHARHGGKGKNIYEGQSYRYAAKHAEGLADATLARMVALKRRQYGEELTAGDKEELRKYDEEIKASDAAGR